MNTILYLLCAFEWYISWQTFLNWPINLAMDEKKSSESVPGGSPNVTWIASLS